MEPVVIVIQLILLAMTYSDSDTKYDVVNTSLIAPNTNGLICTKHNVEIQVVEF
jgi:hypothetical protein